MKQSCNSMQEDRGKARSDVAKIRHPPKPADGADHRADWKAFGVLPTSRQQRAALFARDSGKCHICGSHGDEWDAEHTHPIWLVDRSDYPVCLAYWSLSNLTTICIPCHKAKTALEAGHRAKVKRIIAKRQPVSTRRKRAVPTRKRDWKSEYRRAKAWRVDRNSSQA